MESDKLRNEFCKTLINHCGQCYTMLDKNNIVWKFVEGVWMGKRSVWTFDWRSCWLEETTADNVKSWWCGKESDYSEIFYNE